MGISTNAYLYFGFDFLDKSYGYDEDNEGQVFTEEDLGHWEEMYAAHFGIKDDSNLYTEDGRDYAVPEGPERERRNKLGRDYREKMRQVVTASGCNIGSHCSGECPIYFVYTRKFRSYRGDSKVINASDLQVTEADVQKLKEFCEILGIKWKEPAWRLASYWG